MNEDVAGLVERLDQEFGRARRTYSFPIKPADFIDLIVAIRALVAERDKWNDMHTRECEMRDRYRIKLAAAEAKLREAVEVMWTLYHAACGPTGFAAAVRATSGVPYPWPALDEADDLARAFLADMEKQDVK
jgi:hypothetical protein